MPAIKGFSERFALPNIPEGPGVWIIENETGEALQIAFASNIRRRIGSTLDSEGITCGYGPKIYGAKLNGDRIYVRWKLTKDYKAERDRLVDKLNPQWQ